MLSTRVLSRIYWCRSLSTSNNLHSSAETNSELIKKMLGYDDTNWNNEENSFLNKYDRNNILDSYKLLKKFGYSDADIKSELRTLCLKPQTITSRYRMFIDYCFQKDLISPTLLRHFVKTMSLNIYQIKHKGYIDKYKDVLGHVNKKLNISVQSLSEKMPLKRIHCEFSVHHLMSVLNISHEEAKYKFKRYPNLKSRSFKCIQENVHVLTKKVGFTHERIKKNAFLLHADKENLLSLLKKYPKLGSVDMKQIIQAYPILVLSPIRNIESVIKCVQKFGYTLEHLSKAPMILILKPSTVEQRLTQIHTEEWLQPYSGLPRTLMLVLTLPSLEKRRAVLQDLNMKCISINVLACTKILFNAYVKHGRDKLNSEDAYLYLSNKLNVPFEKITQKLQTHPYKRYVSIQQIHNSLTFLLGKFSEDNIYNNLQLVLYPVNVIEAALEKLTSGSDTSLDTTPCHDANGNIKEELILPLTLYVIEKQTNFTGYGIWEEEEEEDGEVEHNANLDSPVSMLPIRKKKRKPSFRNLRRS